ncbi:hypothetical protein J6590_078379 [Homalodisca vitripennis]|nr:hypothetical protein J6590_089718 [Homalodisca vitripennis]KAG8275824.1 hypothetical protein J6590_078379 [Homalodisca vitripennis]
MEREHEGQLIPLQKVYSGSQYLTEETPPSPLFLSYVADQPSHRPCWNKEFRCDNGECIRPGELCDGHPDCQDLSDESNCSESDFVECGDGSKVHRYYWCDHWPECATSHLDDTNRSYYHNIYLQVTSWNVETEAKSTATTGVTIGLNVQRHTWTTPTDHIITIFIYR